MDTTTTSLALFSSLSFFCYGFSCLRSDRMKQEFERFGLARQRALTGWLQLTGAGGLLVGLKYTGVGCFAAGGLALLMLLGIGVRFRVGDSLVQTMPAIGYAVVNIYLALAFSRLG